jgi:DNA-binding NtrC family response regulator
MIVDDHAVIRDTLRALFEDEDLRVTDAADGAECLQRAQEEKPSLRRRDSVKGALSAGIFAVVSKSDSDASKQLLAHARTLLGSDGADVPARMASD